MALEPWSKVVAFSITGACFKFVCLKKLIAGVGLSDLGN